MLDRIGRPTLHLNAITKFDDREVGITHPDKPSYFRLTDKGTVEAVCKPGLGIFMNPQNNSITVVADDVRFITNDKNGLKWNDLSFNPKATIGTEPSFVKMTDVDFQSIYAGFEDYLNG